MVKILWEKGMAMFTHPCVWQAIFLSYWSRGHIGWVVASWGLLVGLSGSLYFLTLYAPHYLDILLLFGNSRRFLIFWHLLMLFGMRAATAEPILAYWLNFFLWHTAIAWLLHLRWTFSLHVQGWAALMVFFGWYGRTYPIMAVLCVVVWGLVSYHRWQTGSHSPQEVGLGSLVGTGASVGYILM